MQNNQTTPPLLAEDSVDLSYILSAIGRHLITLIGLPIIFAVSAGYFAMLETPVYRARAMMQIDPKPAQALNEVQDVYNPGYGTDRYYTTQIHLINSRKLAERVVDRLKLYEFEEFTVSKPSFIQKLINYRSWLPFVSRPTQKPKPSIEKLREIAIGKVRQFIYVSQVPDSNMFMVSAGSEDPELAAKIANELVDLYIEESLQAKLEVTQKAVEWLTSKLDDISGSLNQAEGKLQQFREEQQLVNVGGNRGLVDAELIDLSKRLRDAQRRRISLDNTYREISRAGSNPQALADISALLLDPVVTSASNAFTAASTTVDRLKKRYGARHPEMSAASAKLEAARSAYHQALRLKAEGIRSEFEIARRNEQELESAVRRARNKIQNLDRKQFEISVLQREVNSNRQLYDLFLARFKETQSSSSYQEVNARLIDKAIKPGVPFSPNIMKQILVWATVGAIFSVLIMVLREALRSEIEGLEDLEHTAGLPVLGVLPDRGRKTFKKTPVRLLVKDPKAPFADGIRSIRSAIALSDVDKKWKKLMITSAGPQEGKTTISSGLAVTFSQHEKVLIIDTDLRRPRIHQSFGISGQKPGLADLLAGNSTLDQCLLHDKVTGVYILRAGTLPANPAQLLGSETFQHLLDELSSQFDRIIFDSAPCGMTSDALALVPVLDAVVVIARSEKTKRKALANTLKQLRTLGAPVIGTVLNGQRKSRLSGSYYGYGGYYKRY